MERRSAEGTTLSSLLLRVAEIAELGWRRFTCMFETPADYIKLFLYLGALYIGLTQIPSKLWDPVSGQVMLALGAFGLWRYFWWFLHFVRAQIYKRLVYPKRRAAAQELWESGWRPNQLNFLITAYRERRDTLQRVISAVLAEVNAVGVPAKIFIGIGDDNDDQAIAECVARAPTQVPVEIVLIRQFQTGKRFTMGLLLRSMLRNGVGGDDPVVFMDGDSVLTPGCMRKCLPLFALFPKMHGLTTNETAEVHGPHWVKRWLQMRFVQRNLSMESYALSDKVLTLTGRMSVFRARKILNLDFIRLIEADHLDHWLWNEFRFLSGDDKSSWYYLLREGADMFYVPDATVITIEHIEGDPIQRMVQNLMRWSGNMLRNGLRAITLGPKQVGYFIWWCLLDQRISMWTTLTGPIVALAAAIFISPAVLVMYVLWIALTRFVMASFLFYDARRVYLSFIFFLYINQLLNSVVKIYMLFRLPRQLWYNRGVQLNYKGSAPWKNIAKYWIANYLTALWVTVFAFGVLSYVGLVVPFPLW